MTSSTDRATPIYRAAARAAADQFYERLQQAGVVWPEQLRSNQPLALVRQMMTEALRTYQDQSQVPKLAKRDYSPFTKVLAAMQQGEEVDAPNQPLQALRGRMKSARQIMNNPDAVWVCKTVNGTIKVTRLEDGMSATYRDPALNPKVMEIAHMRPGASIIAKHITGTRSGGHIDTNIRIQARKLMGEPEANWKSTMTTKGVRVTRIK